MHPLRWLHRILLFILSLQLQHAATFPGAHRLDSDRHAFQGVAIDELASRQFTGSLPDVIVDDNCVPKCTARTCGDVCPVLRRANPRLTPSLAAAYLSGNASVELSKRAFVVNPARWTPELVREYILARVQDNGPVDPQFAGVGLGGFVADDNSPDPDVTVSQQVAFGDAPLQWGTGGLHGCTMLAIVSNRGAWMAHFWEVGAFCGFDDWNVHTDRQGNVINCQADWDAQVDGVLFGQSTAFTDPVNFDLFNHPGDNTLLIFMTPFKDPRPPKQPFLLQYPNKITRIIDNLKLPGRIPGAGIIIYPYQALDYGDPNDANAVNTDERGQCLFQWDGSEQWRLFYEASYYTNIQAG